MLPQAVILVAGRGRRLLPQTRTNPKCLIPIGRGTILVHQLNNLRTLGFEDVVIVCGFGADRVRATASEFKRDLHIQFVVNEHYSIGDNLISLWLTRNILRDSFVLINGDNLFHPEILELLTRSANRCCLMINRKSCYDDDDMKVKTKDNRIVRIGKTLDPRSVDAESVGIMKFTSDAVDVLKVCLDEIVSTDPATDCCYLNAVQQMIDGNYEVGYSDVGDLPWADVDTLEDLNFVRTHFSHFTSPQWLEAV